MKHQGHRGLWVFAGVVAVAFLRVACGGGLGASPAATTPSGTALAIRPLPTPLAPLTDPPPPVLESQEDSNQVQARPGFTTEDFTTNFDKLASGGPPKDGIPAIDDP